MQICSMGIVVIKRDFQIARFLSLIKYLFKVAISVMAFIYEKQYLTNDIRRIISTFSTNIDWVLFL